MASKKGAGTSKNGRDSNSQRLGFKAFAGHVLTAGSIILRQRGTKVRPGMNVGLGHDHTLFAKVDGTLRMSGAPGNRRAHVVPLAAAAAAPKV